VRSPLEKGVEMRRGQKAGMFRTKARASPGRNQVFHHPEVEFLLSSTGYLVLVCSLDYRLHWR
jgi:hypothetical protein